MSEYDRWLDKDLDGYYSEDEDLDLDEDWKIDRYIEDQERESFDD